MKKLLLLFALLTFTLGNAQDIGWLLVDDNFIKQDTQAHIAGEAFIGVASYYLFYDITNGDEVLSLILANLSGFIIGQAVEESTERDNRDIKNNFYGCGIGSTIAALNKRRVIKRNDPKTKQFRKAEKQRKRDARKMKRNSKSKGIYDTN